MDRRKFMTMLTGGLVATATMAEADRLADFLKWIKKGPTEYSFPTKTENWKEYTLAYSWTSNHLIFYDDSWKQVENVWAMSYAK